MSNEKKVWELRDKTVDLKEAVQSNDHESITEICTEMRAIIDEIDSDHHGEKSMEQSHVIRHVSGVWDDVSFFNIAEFLNSLRNEFPGIPFYFYDVDSSHYNEVGLIASSEKLTDAEAKAWFESWLKAEFPDDKVEEESNDANDGASGLTQTLHYKGVEFHLTEVTDEDRIYTSADRRMIKTAICDYDGALIGAIDESFREDPEDDMIRYFHFSTGQEEE